MGRHKRNFKLQMTQDEARKYLLTVLNWKEFIRGHQKVKVALESILNVSDEKGKELNE